MRLSFGRYYHSQIEEIPEDYLCWICAHYKSGGKAKYAGEKPWNQIPEKEYLEARRILKERGYNTKGIWPTKEI